MSYKSKPGVETLRSKRAVLCSRLNLSSDLLMIYLINERCVTEYEQEIILSCRTSIGKVGKLLDYLQTRLTEDRFITFVKAIGDTSIGSNPALMQELIEKYREEGGDVSPFQSVHFIAETEQTTAETNETVQFEGISYNEGHEHHQATAQRVSPSVTSRQQSSVTDVNLADDIKGLCDNVFMNVCLVWTPEDCVILDCKAKKIVKKLELPPRLEPDHAFFFNSNSEILLIEKDSKKMVLAKQGPKSVNVEMYPSDGEEAVNRYKALCVETNLSEYIQGKILCVGYLHENFCVFGSENGKIAIYKWEEESKEIECLGCTSVRCQNIKGMCSTEYDDMPVIALWGVGRIVGGKIAEEFTEEFFIDLSTALPRTPIRIENCIFINTERNTKSFASAVRNQTDELEVIVWKIAPNTPRATYKNFSADHYSGDVELYYITREDVLVVASSTMCTNLKNPEDQTSCRRQEVSLREVKSEIECFKIMEFQSIRDPLHISVFKNGTVRMQNFLT